MLLRFIPASPSRQPPAQHCGVWPCRLGPGGRFCGHQGRTSIQGRWGVATVRPWRFETLVDL